MPFDIKQIALVVVATLAAACSSTPAIAPDTASTAAAAPASVADANLVKAGYSVMRRHGEVLYCRNEVITGQRIGTRICLTAAQIQDEKQNVTKGKDLLNQAASRCVGATCNN